MPIYTWNFLSLRIVERKRNETKPQQQQQQQKSTVTSTTSERKAFSPSPRKLLASSLSCSLISNQIHIPYLFILTIGVKTS